MERHLRAVPHMKSATLVAVAMVGAVGLACVKDKPADTAGITEVTRGTTQVKVPSVEVSPEASGSMARTNAIRKHMRESIPEGDVIVRGIIITDDGDLITLTGIVPDEETHQALLKAARETPDVKRVKDELKVKTRH